MLSYSYTARSDEIRWLTVLSVQQMDACVCVFLACIDKAFASFLIMHSQGQEVIGGKIGSGDRTTGGETDKAYNSNSRVHTVIIVYRNVTRRLKKTKRKHIAAGHKGRGKPARASTDQTRKIQVSPTGRTYASWTMAYMTYD